MCDCISDKNLGELSLPAAMRLAVAMSGKNDMEVCKDMGWEARNGFRMLNPHDDYWPGVPSLPRLCAVLGNDVLPRWVRVQAAQAAVHQAAPLTPVNLLADLAGLFARTGAVAKRGQASIADGVISPAEARQIRRSVEDVVRLSAHMLDRLVLVGGEFSQTAQ